MYKVKQYNVFILPVSFIEFQMFSIFKEIQGTYHYSVFTKGILYNKYSTWQTCLI